MYFLQSYIRPIAPFRPVRRNVAGLSLLRLNVTDIHVEVNSVDGKSRSPVRSDIAQNPKYSVSLPRFFFLLFALLYVRSSQKEQ